MCYRHLFDFIYLLWCLVFVFKDVLAASNVPHNPKIAVIGAGIGGTSCVYFLNKLFDGKAAIDIYEANKVGGRLLLEEVDGSFFEAGGTIIHPKNKYMKDFVHEFGLHMKKEFSDGVSGLYNGEEFTFVESKSQYITFIKMLWHYGIDLFKLHSYVSYMLDDFDKIYFHQKKGQGYEMVQDLLNSMNSEFSKFLTTSVEDGFKGERSFNQRVVDELVYATIRVNYGQSNLVHQFVGSVSVAGAMDGLWAVKEGNYKVAEKLLQSSSAKLIMKKVINIAAVENKTKFNVTTGDTTDEYDAVVIAAPMTSDVRFPINFLNFPSSISIPGSYHTTICTLVTGTIDNKFFGYDNGSEVPSSILTVNGSLFYNSISLLKLNGEHSVYKIFSQTVLTNKQLNLLFKRVHNVKVIDWLAYPEYSTEVRNDSFILYNRLYYVNAIEWAASAMEMSVIGGRNVALLVHNDLTEPFIKDSKVQLPKKIEL